MDGKSDGIAEAVLASAILIFCSAAAGGILENNAAARFCFSERKLIIVREYSRRFLTAMLCGNARKIKVESRAEI